MDLRVYIELERRQDGKMKPRLGTEEGKYSCFFEPIEEVLRANRETFQTIVYWPNEDNIQIAWAEHGTWTNLEGEEVHYYCMPLPEGFEHDAGGAWKVR